MLAVACSGGRDSLALLHALWIQVRQNAAFRVLVLHVHHGLSSQADAWRDQLRQTCRRWQRRARAELKFVALHVDVCWSSPAGLEAEARERRYEALTQTALREGARIVLLAHHRDDQTETVLLQTLRGAGPAGLSAMPEQIQRDGLLWIRPWLNQPRSAIEAYLRRHRLLPVEDESNADPRFARNRLRHQILPGLRQAFPQVDVALGAVARHAQDAAACLEELARLDLERCRGATPLVLNQAALRVLSAARCRNLFRYWLIDVVQVSVTEALLLRLSRETLADVEPGGGRRRWRIGAGRWLGLHRGQLICEDDRGSRSIADAKPEGAQHLPPLVPGRHTLPGWPRGVLVVRRALPGEPGIEAERLLGLGALQVTGRRPGWQFQLHARSMPRALVKQFQARNVAMSLRDGPYLVTGQGRLLFAPGLGLDGRFQDEEVSDESHPRLKISWDMQDCVGQDG